MINDRSVIQGVCVLGVMWDSIEQAEIKRGPRRLKVLFFNHFVSK